MSRPLNGVSNFIWDIQTLSRPLNRGVALIEEDNYKDHARVLRWDMRAEKFSLTGGVPKLRLHCNKKIQYLFKNRVKRSTAANLKDTV